MMQAGREAEPVDRVKVRVWFLRQDRPSGAPTASTPPPSLPEGGQVVTLTRPSVTYYRFLYDTVGAEYLWWLRRIVPDDQLARHLGTPGVSVHVLYVGGEPAGFFELDARPWPTVNLNYFGLMPHFIGRGFGRALLAYAVDLVWRHQARAMTLNTCSADHPRALPGYLAQGFIIYREIEEIWEIPKRLGLRIPERMRGALLPAPA